MLMYQKLNLRLQPREKVPFNEERTYQMKNIKKTLYGSTIVIHMVHVQEEINMSIRKVSHSVKYHSVI